MKADFMLYDLAIQIRDSSALSNLFKENPGNAFFKACENNKEGRKWLSNYHLFLDYCGQRGNADRDLH